MSEEELEKTGVLKDIINKQEDEEMTIDEMIEEFLEEVDFLNISDKKKKTLKKLSLEITKEKDALTKKNLFNLLIKSANEK